MHKGRFQQNRQPQAWVATNIGLALGLLQACKFVATMDMQLVDHGRDPMPANAMPPHFHGALKRQAGTFALLCAVENGY